MRSTPDSVRRDDGETVGLMEPMLPADGVPASDALTDLTFELTACANRLAGKLCGPLRDACGDLMRSMNCYYSNLIEGHITLLADIEAALRSDYANDVSRRNLQREAAAHIAVQAFIDRDDPRLSDPWYSEAFMCAVHREFCERLPDDMLWVEDSQAQPQVRLSPGELRTRDVVVGRHHPVSAGSLQRFLVRFAAAYGSASLSKPRRILAVAAAHHRFLWIHPFLDGNGRVARLMSHAALHRLNVGCSLWSVARGLARRRNDYKALLMDADAQRRGDLDGRGTLSQAALTSFCSFFLQTCIDQVTFMDTLLDIATLQSRVRRYVEEEAQARRLHPTCFPVLREALLTGSVQRNQIAGLTGLQERQARTVLAQLLHKRLLIAQGPRDAARINLPLSVAERWFPGLYVAADAG